MAKFAPKRFPHVTADHIRLLLERPTEPKYWDMDFTRVVRDTQRDYGIAMAHETNAADFDRKRLAMQQINLAEHGRVIKLAYKNLQIYWSPSVG